MTTATLTRKEAYALYLQSPEWNWKRQRAIQAAGGRCRVCNGDQRLQVHHRTYERVLFTDGRIIGREHPEDLTVLCEDCHQGYELQWKRKTRAGSRKHPSKARRNVKRGQITEVEIRVLVGAIKDQGPMTTAALAQTLGWSHSRAGVVAAQARKRSLLRRKGREWRLCSASV